jgi:NAD(P)H-dependent flavin oxidoreductase YrpB (nitropropane dioxygenase family)
MLSSNFHDPRATQEVKRAVINAASSDNTLVAAVTGKKIRVLAALFTLAGTTPTARFESGTGGTALTGVMAPTAGSVIHLPYNPLGWFETAAAELLNLELTGTSPSAQGVLVYAEVPTARRAS